MPGPISARSSGIALDACGPSGKLATGSLPLRICGRVAPMLSASVGPCGAGSSASRRFIHPSGVVLRPGVPFSMNSCASKCDRVGSVEPAAWTKASFFSVHNGISPRSAG